MAAARELFRAQGYDKTSTVQIADRAGVSEGILFHHFGSKRGLFAQLAEQHAHAAASATMPENPENLTEETVVRGAFDFADRDPDMFRLLMEDGAKLDGFDVTEHSEIIISVIEKNLKRGMAEGHVRRGDPRVMAELNYALVDGAYRAWRKSGQENLRETYIREAIASMRSMLAPNNV